MEIVLELGRVSGDEARLNTFLNGLAVADLERIASMPTLGIETIEEPLRNYAGRGWRRPWPVG